jgi:ferredoxin
MIITRMKPFEEVQAMTEAYEKIFIVGCGTCSTSCQTGGEEQVSEMAEKLGDKVVGTAMVEEPCDRRIARKLPASDTLFIGETERIGKFYDRCMACGECILDETGGICPITRCPKALLNGPCGGQVEGKCEVGEYTYDCAWVLIYDRLKEQDRLDLFMKFRPPRDYSKKTLTIEHIF